MEFLWLENPANTAGELRNHWTAVSIFYLFIICLDYVLRTSIHKIRENGS